MDKLKIFLAYHKDTPIYKSEVFIPIQAGRAVNEELSNIIGDNTDDNISELNPYYCELTAYYWVLKNFIPTTNSEYIGFFHYRRLPDIENISELDTPSIYGLNLTQADWLFQNLTKNNLIKYCKNYDVILPCSVYMYKDTVNPEFKENILKMYEQFKEEHKNNLLDILKEVINEFYPEYNEALEISYNSLKGYFFNSYIMKKKLMEEYLNWLFDVLKKTGDKIGSWENEKYLRMAGFLAEILTNIWLNKNTHLKKGFVPIYMIDFTSEYIEQANKYHKLKDYNSEYEIIKELVKYINDFNTYSSLLKLSLLLDKKEEAQIYFEKSLKKANTSDEYYELGRICEKYDSYKEECFKLYKKSALCDTTNKLFSQKFLNYCEEHTNINIIKEAWDLLKRFKLTENEVEKYSSFKRCFDLISKNK